MEPIIFSDWKKFKKFIEEKTGCKPFSGAGICPRPKQKTTLLRSVDDTYYYDDNLIDINNPLYTLFGHNGDQDVNEKRFNEPLLNKNKTEHIYLYRVKKDGTKKIYEWYGKYEIIGRNEKRHQGKDNIIRTIIVLSLKRL